MQKLIVNGVQIRYNSIEIDGDEIRVDTPLSVEAVANRPTSSAVRMLAEDRDKIIEERDEAREKIERLIQMLEEASWFGLVEEVPHD